MHDRFESFHDHLPRPLSIVFRLGDNGWATMHIASGDEAVDVGSFGYCTDALGDLVRAALMIATNSPRAEAVFDGEPALWGIAVQDGSQSRQNPPALRLLI